MLTGIDCRVDGFDEGRFAHAARTPQQRIVGRQTHGKSLGVLHEQVAHLGQRLIGRVAIDEKVACYPNQDFSHAGSLNPTAVRAAAVFMLVASTIGLRTGFLPRWLVVAGYVCGLVFLLSVTYVEWLILLLPAWLIAVSVVILRASGGRASSPVEST